MAPNQPNQPNQKDGKRVGASPQPGAAKAGEAGATPGAASGQGKGAAFAPGPAAEKKAAAAPPKTPEPVKPVSVDPDELVSRADAQRGLPAAELLVEAAAGYRGRNDVVGTVHSLERALAEISEQIESPTGAQLGARIEHQLGQICEEDLGRYEDALVHYQRAFKLNPVNLEPLRRGRVIYQSLGDMDMVARLIELHMGNLPVSETKAAIPLALELGQLRLRLNDPAGAVEALRGALRTHNEAAANEEIPETLLATLADAYVSADYQPGINEKDAARRHASEIYLSLARRYLDPALAQALRSSDDNALVAAVAPSPAEGGKGREPTDNDRKAIQYLRKSLDADARNVTAAGLLEALFSRLPAAQRTSELIKLYKSGARVSRRGPKLLKLYEEAGGAIDFGAVIDACRTGLDAVASVDEWTETRECLRDMLQRSGDQLGLAALREEDAAEAALPEERADLIMQAAELYQKGGDQERYIACLKQAFQELPLHTEAFRKLSDFYKSRRDFIGLAVIQENRMAAQFETARLDLQSYTKQLEELAELYEKKLLDVVSAAAIWRRIDEILPSARSQSERKRLGQRLSRIEASLSELQVELERVDAENIPQRVEILRRLGQLYRELHEPKHAASVYEELLSLSPSDLPALKTLIELREQGGDVPGQLELLQQQATMVTDRAERLALLRRMMGLCDQRMLHRDGYDAQDGLEMTIWVCRALLAELPNDRDALRRLSDALALTGNKAELLEVQEAYLKVAPTPREKLSLHLQIAKVAEDTGDLARAVSHLERAVRICPPGPESEQVLSELSRIYGLQGRTELAVQTLELCLKQNPRASIEIYRLLGRLTLSGSGEPALLEKSAKALREVLHRLPDDVEALAGLQKLHRLRGDWGELVQVLQKQLRVDGSLSPRERLTAAIELSEVYSQHMNDPKQAAALLEKVQAELPIVDLRVHRHLRGLYEEMGDFVLAARAAERELLLTEDPLLRMERALELATLFRTRAKDRGRAILSYERVLRLYAELAAENPDSASARQLVMQALESLSQMFVESGQWTEVILLGRRRLELVLEQGETVPAAQILLSLAQVYEEKLQQPREGFELRQHAFEMAPHVAPIEHLHAIAERYGLWAELCALHVARVDQALNAEQSPPLESALAGANIYEEHLEQPGAAFKLLRRSLIPSGDAALAATTPGSETATLLADMERLVKKHGVGTGPEDSLSGLEGVTMVRELLLVYRGLVDDLYKLNASSEDVALRLHGLLGASARLREEVNRDAAGALQDLLHAFTVSGERDHSADPAADAVFARTVSEIHRLAVVSGQVKEAIAIDTRRLDRADSEFRRQQVACEMAAWLDDYGGDPQRALKYCIKALGFCAEGSDAQSEIRGRLYRLGQRLGLLGWDEIARAERSLVQQSPAKLQKRLMYLAALWQYGAADFVRAIDAAGQAYRLTYFPGGLPSTSAAKAGPPLSELVAHHPSEELLAARQAARALLDRIASAAPTDSEGAGKLVSLLDNLAGQLNEAGVPTQAAQVLLDVGQVDERRNRLSQAERRYQEVLKQQVLVEQAMAALERVYRQQRRLADLAALLEKRRPLMPESAQRQMLLDLAEVYREINKFAPALTALQQAIAIDDSDAGPYLLMARIYEGQKTFLRAVECYKSAAQRSPAGEVGDAQAARALVAAGDLCERKLNEAGEALELYQQALRRALTAILAAREAGRTPAAQLLSDRDAAIAATERMLTQGGRSGELEGLLRERIRLTASVPSTLEERQALLGRLLEMLVARRYSGAVSPEHDADLLATAAALRALKADDEAFLAEQEQLLIDLGQLEAARDVAAQRVEVLTRLGKSAEDIGDRLLGLGERELALSNQDTAAAAIERALVHVPDSSRALRALVWLHERSGNKSAQLEALLRLAARESDPEQASLAEIRAARLSWEQLEDAPRAKELLQAALEKAEAAKAPARSQEALYTLFELAVAEGDPDAAAGFAERALRTGAVSAERTAALCSFLGKRALDKDDGAAAARYFEAALAAQPGQLEPTRALIGLLGPRGEYGRIDSLITETLDAAEELAPDEEAALLRTQAEARQQLGQQAEALEALRAADELSPGDAAQTLWLGELAYGLGELPLAARCLSSLVPLVAGDARPAGIPDEVLADGFDHGAAALLSLSDLATARSLLKTALRLAPQHQDAGERYLELLLSDGERESAGEAKGLLVARAEHAAANGEAERSSRYYIRAAEVAVARLDDAAQAHDYLKLAEKELTAAMGDLPTDEQLAQRQTLLLSLYESARRIADLSQARAYAEKLFDLSTEPAEQSRWLGLAADCALAEGKHEEARALLEKVLERNPGDLTAVGHLAPLLSDEEAGPRLFGLLEPLASPAEPETQAQLLGLWEHVAKVYGRLDQREAAATSYERALTIGALLGASVEGRLRRAALEVLPETAHDRARGHLQALLAGSPLDLELLTRLHSVEERAGQAGAAWRLAQVLHVLQGEVSQVPAPGPATAIPVGLKLEEADHARWALPEARSLSEVFVTLWDGVYGQKGPPLDSFGVASSDRVSASESSTDDVARLFAVACRVLGNQKGGLYRQGWTQFVIPKIMGKQPTAAIVSPGIGRRTAAEQQFLLARAVEELRPEYLLAASMPPPELSKLLGMAVRGFHPRHVRSVEGEVAAWKRELPYRVVKRLGELFRDLSDVQFSTVAWRQAVRRTVQRAALLVSGDLVAAASVLRTVDVPAAREADPAGGPYLRLGLYGADPAVEAEADLVDLCVFFLSTEAGALIDRLHPRSQAASS